MATTPICGRPATRWFSKALAIVLGKHLPVSRRCTHIKGHSGAKSAVREVRDHLAANRFVLRTNVKSYYASAGGTRSGEAPG